MESALGRERGHRRDEVLMPRTFPNRQESTKLFYCSLPLYLVNKSKKKDILNRRQNILEGITRPLRQQRISKKSKKSRR